MNRGLSHLDITQIFVDVDDFCQVFEPLLAGLLLPEVSGHSLPKSRLSLSEIMTTALCTMGTLARMSSTGFANAYRGP